MAGTNWSVFLFQCIFSPEMFVFNSSGTFSLWCHPKFEDRCHSVVEFIERAIMHSKNGKFLYFLRSRVPGKATSTHCRQGSQPLLLNKKHFCLLMQEGYRDKKSLCLFFPWKIMGNRFMHKGWDIIHWINIQFEHQHVIFSPYLRGCTENVCV